MKLKTILPILFVVFFSSYSFGQETKHIVYDITISSDDPQMQAMQSMFDGSNLEIFTNEKFCRVNMKIGSMTTTNTIIDLSNKKAILLISSMMGKMAAKMDSEDLSDSKKDLEQLDVKLVDGTKEIAGYPCKKAILTSKDSLKLDVWYTTDLSLGDLTGTPLAYDKIPGTPLEFSTEQGPMKMTYTASKIESNATVDAGIFDMTIPEGYKEVSMDDLKKMGGGQ